MSERFSLFSKEALLFGLTITVGLLTAHRYVRDGAPVFLEPIETDLTSVLVFAVVFILFTVLIIKFVRAGTNALRLAMALAIFVGTQFVAGAFVPEGWSYVVAGAFMVAPLLSRSQYLRMASVLGRFLPVILIHNLAMAISIAGIAALVGLSLTPLWAVILLAGLSFYDIVAVYYTRHMVAIAERMMSAGAVFGFLIPVRWRDLLLPPGRSNLMPRAMILGSGDVGLPLVLTTSVVSTSVGAAVVVGAFSLVGITMTHWLFMAQRKRAAMAALPPVATTAIIGYLVAVLLGI
jgi:presenilin-like A22 family membrane protease